MNPTKIEWADASIQVVTGCTKISPGCDSCYALRRSNLLAHNPGIDPGRRAAYAQAVQPVPVSMQRAGHKIRWSGQVTEIPGWREKLAEICKGKKPKRIFLQSMGDLFHPDMPLGPPGMDYTNPWWLPLLAIAHVGAHPHHTGIVLTKRPERMLQMTRELGLMPLPDMPGCTPSGEVWPANVIAGATAESQEQAFRRLPYLLSVPAPLVMVSVEPMLGPVDLTRIEFPLSAIYEDAAGVNVTLNALTGAYEYSDGRSGFVRPLSWVICGGETGPAARPMHPDWARSLRDQCRAAGVPFFFKSWGEWLLIDHPDTKPEKSFRVGKRRAGNLLDGREWLEVPA